MYKHTILFFIIFAFVEVQAYMFSPTDVLSVPQATTKGEDQLTLTISIRNIRYTNTVRIGIFTSKETFLQETKALRNYTVRPSNRKTADIAITDLPSGEYAIAIYQDLNEDTHFDRNFLGIPIEPYGVSNNIKPMFAPPNYNDCRFQHLISQTHIIYLLE